MPKIFYWMGDTDIPYGGEKHCYEHVDILNSAGFDAYALHLRGRRYTWFDTDTRIVCGAAFWDIFDQKNDYLVVPENLGTMMAGLPGRLVIFNKNLYYGFQAFGDPAAVSAYPYTDERVVMAFTVSGHNYEHLRFAFPRARIVRVYAGIDPALYRFRPWREKGKQIAIVAKSNEALLVLMHMLRARALAGLNALGDYKITLLRNLSSREAAEVLADSVLLVSVSTHEGLPRTVLEAMSCGCAVVCYGTGPLKEILPPEYACEPDDLVGMACRIEAVTAGFPGNAGEWAPVVERARQTAAAFSPARARTVVLDAWQTILTERASLLAPASAIESAPAPAAAGPLT